MLPHARSLALQTAERFLFVHCVLRMSAKFHLEWWFCPFRRVLQDVFCDVRNEYLRMASLARLVACRGKRERKVRMVAEGIAALTQRGIELFSLSGKVALVTGGNGGLGRAMALGLRGPPSPSPGVTLPRTRP